MQEIDTKPATQPDQAVHGEGPGRPMVSVVSPAYNEAENLPLMYDLLSSAMSKLDVDWEWIVVDDSIVNWRIIDRTANSRELLAQLRQLVITYFDQRLLLWYIGRLEFRNTLLDLGLAGRRFVIERWVRQRCVLVIDNVVVWRYQRQARPRRIVFDGRWNGTAAPFGVLSLRFSQRVTTIDTNYVVSTGNAQIGTGP